MAQPTKRKPSPSSEWKEKLTSLLREQGIIWPDFTGRLELNIYQGGVSGCKREDTLK